ncbi:glycosyltransferase family 2 protein [Marinobacter salarius]|uniref:glycosyltransferase n=3 Tax=Marinobacter TaxID=2742 RepID=UPI0018F11061|nr:glycosyltransferase family 2 protein [Marinobacter salarius]MBJ7277709.1 glycosyltransferase family 2 protein [Marinobacter salarius]
MDLSVIIPAFNEEDYVSQCLSSVKNVLGGRDIDYEILLVDNGSCDKTSQIASSFSGVSVFSISRTSVSQARNYGAQKAQGRIFAFIDADVVLKSIWGERIEALCNGCNKLFVTGYQYGVRDEPSWIEKYWFSNLKSNHISGGNLIVSCDAFLKIGGFDPGLKTGEDVDFCSKAKLIPDIEYTTDPSLVCVHLGYPSTVYQFMKRELWHGEGDFRSLRDFRKSKIAKLSLGYGAASLVFFGALAIQEWYLASLIFFVFILSNYVLVCLRFDSWWGKASFFNSFINYLYFISRFFSLFRAVRGRNRVY